MSICDYCYYQNKCFYSLLFWWWCEKGEGRAERGWGLVGNKAKEERFSNQKLLKSIYQGQNVTVLALLEHVEFRKLFPWPFYFKIHFGSPL